MSREQNGVYDPEELLLLGEVFDRALASLPTALQTPVNRRQIATHILACAAAGERDPSELERAAVNLGMHGRLNETIFPDRLPQRLPTRAH